ncbi:hypothetical protein GTQ40_12410 [Flavobacteriaceae bacterium R38]|nr:hypothetical protein [Flavobacteriaceae bacterium R38]
MKTRYFLSLIIIAFLSSTELYSQELNNHSNAAADPNNTETNATTGFSSFASNGVISSTTDSNTGSYAIKFERTTTGSPRLYFEFEVVAGQEYELKYTGKEDTGVDARLRQFLGLNGNQQSFTDTYQPFDQILTATITGTARLEWFILSGDIGGSLYIDNLSIRAVNAADIEAPTSPTLISTGQSDTTVDLTWSGATDNTAVTEYKLFKNGVMEATLGAVSSYQVSGLDPQNYYEFTLTALDAAGNQSSLSNVVAVTTDQATSTSTGNQTPGNWTLDGDNLFYNNGNVGIGTTAPGIWKLAVNGNIRAKGVKVETGWADYVFEHDYNLPTLEEVARHIKEKGHLINIPSAKEVELNGIELGEMNKLLLEKIEELTLYILQQEKTIQKQSEQLEQLKDLEQRLLKLEQEK